MAGAPLASAAPCQHCARERLDEQARRHRLVAELGELAASVRVHEAARRKEVEELMSEREWLLDSLRVACAALREADAERASRLSLPSELELLDGVADSRDGGRGDGGGGNGGGDGAGGEGRAGEGGGGEDGGRDERTRLLGQLGELLEPPDGVELLADPTGEAGRAFGVSRGWRPDDARVPPALKLFVVGVGL